MAPYGSVDETEANGSRPKLSSWAIGAALVAIGVVVCVATPVGARLGLTQSSLLSTDTILCGDRGYFLGPDGNQRDFHFVESCADLSKDACLSTASCQVVDTLTGGGTPTDAPAKTFFTKLNLRGAPAVWVCQHNEVCLECGDGNVPGSFACRMIEKELDEVCKADNKIEDSEKDKCVAK